MPARTGFGPPTGSSPALTSERAPKRALLPDERGGAPSAEPAEPTAPSATDAQRPECILSAFELATFSEEQKNHRAAAVPRVTSMPPPIADGTHRWNPFRLQADAARAQKLAWRSVWPNERLAEYTQAVDEGRLALPSSTPRLDAQQLLQPGLECGRIEGNCGWHVLHDVDQQKGRLFKDSSRARNLALFNADFDALCKRIAFAAVAPVAFAALVTKVETVYKEPALAAWCARTRARARSSTCDWSV